MKKRYLVFCFVFYIITSINIKVHAQAVNLQDSLALVDLYNSTNGPNWYHHANWLSAPVSTWDGIELTGSRVTRINLTSNRMVGTIASSIGNLTKLEVLNLSFNQISGSIPGTIGNLIKLEQLSFSLNQMTGAIPLSIGNLLAMSELDLSSNQFTGTIPSSLGNLSNLTVLSLGNNQLTGTIPHEMGNLPHLSQLYFGRNQLTGTIIPEFASDTSLYSLELDHNNLTGTIPAVLGSLPQLAFLHVQNNQLTGSIPTELGDLHALFDLNAGYNQLSGTIPSSLGNLITLVYALDLSNNQLTGSIPASLGKLVKIQGLDLNNNQLSGLIPTSIGNMAGLYYLLDLSNNQLTGKIPAAIANLPILGSLNLSHNLLTGTIPVEISVMPKLGQLDLSNNQLTGSIPSSFSDFLAGSLQYLYLDSNKLSGDVSVLATIRLLDVNLVHNRFTFEGMEQVVTKFKRQIRYNDQAPITIHQNGNILSVSVGGTPGNNTYGWYRTGGTDTTIIAGDSTFQPLQSGTYHVVARNAVAKKFLLKSYAFDYVAPLTVLNSIAVSKANNTLQQQAEFVVYPNPAKDVLHIQINGSATISIADQAGKILVSKKISHTGDINVGSFAAGIYYIKNNVSGMVQKIIIAK